MRHVACGLAVDGRSRRGDRWSGGLASFRHASMPRYVEMGLRGGTEPMPMAPDAVK